MKIIHKDISDNKTQNELSDSTTTAGTDDVKKESSVSQRNNLEKELSLEQEKNLRLQAEYENYQKRMFKELTDARLSGQLSVLEPVLGLFDNFFLALKLTEDLEDKDPLREGLLLIFKEFNKVLLDLKVERIDAMGKKFDHNLHTAMAYEPSDDTPEGIVIKQWKCGYKMHHNIIRPASVVVSSGISEE